VKQWIKTLHEHFVPSRHNAYQPHLLRFRIATRILSLVLIFEALYLVTTFAVIPRSDHLAAILTALLVEQTNEERAMEELGGLLVSERLTLAAQMKADDMVARGYFAHDAPDGTTPWHWFEKAGYAYAAAGENLAVNFTESRDVTNAWMRSPTHRANIMNGTYTEIGIATAHGTYKGRDAIFVVQEFGRPIEKLPTTPLPSIANVVQNTVAPSEQKIAQSSPLRPREIQTRPTPEVTSFTSTSAPQQPSTLGATAPPAQAVAGTTTTELIAVPATNTPAVSLVGALIASPRNMTNVVLFLFLGIVTLTLGLTVAVKWRLQFPHLIANGILLIAIILSLVLFNFAISSFWGDI
jgi:hypothetical protein